MWLGYGFKRNVAHFVTPHYEDTASDADHKEGMIRVSGVVWYTNLDHNKRHEEMILVQRYHGNEAAYPDYDNYHAIEVSKTQDIPSDYDGIMGVPITFLTKYNPDQFEIIGSDYEVKLGLISDMVKPEWTGKVDRAYLNGKRIYARLFIKNRNISVLEK